MQAFIFTKPYLLEKFCKVANELGIKGAKRIDVIWLLNNASFYGFFSEEGLRRALAFVNDTSKEISFNFKYPICHAALADAGYFCPSVFDYPWEAKVLALQVGELPYYVGMRELNGTDYLWLNVLKPYVDWRAEELNSGNLTPLGIKLNQELKAMAQAGKDEAVIEAAMRCAYPFDVFFNHDLLGRDDGRYLWNSREGKDKVMLMKALRQGVINMQYNASLGCSPFEYLVKFVRENFERKNKVYKLSLLDA